MPSRKTDVGSGWRRSTLTGLKPMASLLAMALAGCGSSPAPAPLDPGVNHHLVYESRLAPDEPAEPHDTVVLDLASTANDHPGSTGTAFHDLAYQVDQVGKYKFCIPADDLHVTEVELVGPDGRELWAWKRGQPCDLVTLHPGRYLLHLHLDSSESDPLVFLKPHETVVKPSAAARGTPGDERLTGLRAAIFEDDIPPHQFLDLYAETLTQIVRHNQEAGLNEHWLVTTTFPSDDRQPSHEAYPSLVADSYFVDGSELIDTGGVLESLWPGGQSLFVLEHDPNTGTVGMRSAWAGAVGLSTGECIDTMLISNEGMSWPWCSETADLLVPGADAAAPLMLDADYFGASFRLWRDSGPLSWVSSRYTLGWGWGREEHVMGQDGWAWVSTAGKFGPVQLTVVARSGWAPPGGGLPLLMPNQVALFDAPFTPSGFLYGSQYWIIDQSLADFSLLSFDNPTNRVHSIMAGRYIQARAFHEPSYSGESFYVSPPYDRELMVTSSDLEQLARGAVGSIQLGISQPEISDAEYENHVIVSARQCVGCDLRGFQLSPELTELDYYDFRGADLSNANLALNGGSGGVVSSTQFAGASLAGAKLNGLLFDTCDFSGTDFTGADLTGVRFSNSDLWYAPVFREACPRFEHVDLTRLGSDPGTRMDPYFGGAWDVNGWWNTRRFACKTSVAYSKVGGSLFADRRNFQFLHAPGADFSNQDMDGAILTGVNLRGANFTNTSLRGAVLVNADLTGAEISGADFTNANLGGAVIAGLRLQKAKSLAGVTLNGIILDKADWSNLSMPGAQFAAKVFQNWDGYKFPPHRALTLSNAYMFNTKLNGANLSGAWLQHVSWYGSEATGENANLQNAHLDHADLPGLNLKQAHLQGASFTDAVLINADLSTTTSVDRTFDGTSFYQANLLGANLSGANLAGAQLLGATLYVVPSKSSVVVEVLDDPTTHPYQYRFYEQVLKPTMAPASSDGISTCPAGSPDASGSCGPFPGELWKTAVAPLEPNCTKDPDGTLHCQSQRHPK